MLGRPRGLVLAFKGAESYLEKREYKNGNVLWSWGEKPSGGAASAVVLRIGVTNNNEVLVARGPSLGMEVLDLQTGAVLFKVKTGGPVCSSPCVVDGKVVFGSHDGKIRIIDATTGAQLWNYDTGERVLSTPCIVDGWLYIGGSCGRFFAFH